MLMSASLSITPESWERGEEEGGFREESRIDPLNLTP